MKQRLKPHLRLLTPGLLALALSAALPGASSAGAPGGARSASSPAATPRAHAASGYMTGIGDEQAQMFTDPQWQQLHTKIARYIAPWDAVAHRASLNQAITWIRAAEAQHVKILVAFYHSEVTPTRLPSVALYKHDVQKFIRLFPHVKQYQAWDEANRGNVPHAFSSPSATLAAQYYQALIRVCTGCAVIGLDVLDQANITPTLEYIAEFKSEIGRLKTITPAIWGLHDYSDVNRLESWRTREISNVLPGQVWLTETGGIVQFGGAFPNHHGSGLARAAKALGYMFKVAGSQSKIKRLYIYDWTGGVGSTRFDAGLTNVHNQPRPGYVVVCRQLHGKNCSVRVARN
jgi:hypothetical protein